MGSDKEVAAIKAVIAKFPATFKLRNHEGEFRISLSNSYFQGPGECGGSLMLYTQRRYTPEDYLRLYGRPHKSENDLWGDFCKGTESELRSQIK